MPETPDALALAVLVSKQARLWLQLIGMLVF